MATTRLYSAGSDLALYTVNVSNGGLSFVGVIGYSLTGLAQHPTTGIVYGATTADDVTAASCLITVDPATGAGTVVGPFGQEVGDISFRSDGVLYAWQMGLDGLCTVNLTTGALTSLGADITGVGILNRGCGLAFDSSDNLFLAPNGAPSDPDTNYYSLDPDTGVPTLVGALSGFDNGPDAVIFGAAFSVADVLYANDNDRGGPSATHLVRISLTDAGPIVPADGLCRFGAYIEGVQTFGFYYPGEAPWDNAPYSSRTWDRFEDDAGKQISLMMLGQPNPWTHVYNYDAAISDAFDRPSIPVVDMATFGTTLASVTAGTHDAAITAWAEAAAADGRPFVLRLNAEMNGTWYDYAIEASSDPSIFVDFWRHVHDLFTAAGASNVEWHWCPNVDPDVIYTPLEDLYPGDDYVDWTGMTGYNSGGLSADFVFSSTYDRLVALAPSKPIMIGETGSVDSGFPGEKVAWTNEFFARLAADWPLVKGFCWFNWRVAVEGNPDWPIESTIETGSGGMAAFAADVAAARYI